MNTTVSNAYVQPLFSRYVDLIQRGLSAAGAQNSLFMMLSSGGITSVETAVANPIRLLESGPAAGALVSAFYGERMGRKNLISFDMGGTTAKICLIKDGRPALTSTFEIARVHRFKRGSGLPVKTPSIELVEIGAGGGSVSRVDELGLLKVGPESAGSSPGPACYGFGGTEPTVTDANLLLGYLNPEFFLGGRMNLDVAAAERAVVGLGTKLGLDMITTASGIYEVVNESMISATRVHVAERGEDPRRIYVGGVRRSRTSARACRRQSPEITGIHLSAVGRSCLGAWVPYGTDCVRFRPFGHCPSRPRGCR